MKKFSQIVFVLLVGLMVFGSFASATTMAKASKDTTSKIIGNLPVR
jgi:hypothetical protein